MRRLVESTIMTLLAGKGGRMFEGVDLTHLTLLDTTTFGSGIVVLTYGPK